MRARRRVNIPENSNARLLLLLASISHVNYCPGIIPGRRPASERYSRFLRGGGGVDREGVWPPNRSSRCGTRSGRGGGTSGSMSVLVAFATSCILRCVTKYSQLAVGPQRVRTCTYPSHCERCRSVHTPPQAGLVTIEARSCATLCGMWGFRSVPEGICRMCRRGVVPYVSYSAVLSGIILAPACAIPHIKLKS